MGRRETLTIFFVDFCRLFPTFRHRRLFIGILCISCLFLPIKKRCRLHGKEKTWRTFQCALRGSSGGSDISEIDFSLKSGEKFITRVESLKCDTTSILPRLGLNGTQIKCSLRVIPSHELCIIEVHRNLISLYEMNVNQSKCKSW